MKCPYCKKKTPDGAKLCVHCGKDVHSAALKKRVDPIYCPTCKVPTRILNLMEIELDFCHECSGIWFDKKEMNHFQKSISEMDNAEKMQHILKEITIGEKRKNRGSYLECPICNDLMVQRNYLGISGILLDQCSQHGIWADKGDLHQILDLLMTGDMEELKAEAERKKIAEIEGRLKNIELNQIHTKAELARLERNQKTHLVLDIFGFL